MRSGNRTIILVLNLHDAQTLFRGKSVHYKMETKQSINKVTAVKKANSEKSFASLKTTRLKNCYNN